MAAVGIALVILVQGRFFLIPLAIAVLLFSLTNAALDRIARIRIAGAEIPNWLATVIGVGAVVAAMLIVFRIIAMQLDAVIAAGPIYFDRVQELVSAMFVWLGDDAVAGLAAAFEDIDGVAYLRSFAGSAGYFLTTSFLILLYVGFLFAERPYFSDKLTRLLPDAGREHRVVRVFHSITRTVHRYILIKTLVSVLTGVVVYFVLFLFGLDFAETWALLSVFLNFIPNIGSIVATIIPTLAALVQFGHWLPALLILATVGVIQFGVGNILEPQLMGRSLNLSPFVIILSLTFWGAVWGIVGMFLAVPIMVMVMIACSHIPPLRPVAILLSRDGKPATED